MQVWAIIIDSFRESRDKKLFWVLLALSTIIAAALACVGFDENGWSFFFGLLKLENPDVRAGSPLAARLMASMVADFLVGLYIGWIGVILCLLGTVGMFPTMMEPGAIEVILGKPISRLKLFAAKYAGSLLFVLVQAVYFVLLTLLVIRLKLGAWLWAYLWAIPLLVLLFSYIYCVCVLAAVWSRNALTSLIVGMVFWIIVSSAGSVEGVYALMAYTQAHREGKAEADLSWSARSSFGRITYVTRLVLPKTDDVPTILRKQMGAATADEVMSNLMGMASEMTAEDRYTLEQEEKRIARLSPLRSIGSSLAFEAVVLIFAWWRFSRKDF